ncbi:MAG: DUF6318 family protein [Actinomycetaceae bacterium]|nr:DUF6318 family protein [Actinomycetaceae bacterium]
MCPDRHDYGGGSPRYSGAARRGEDREFERDDPEMDRVIRRWWWAAGISWLVAICVVYLTFCHKPPQEPSTSAGRPAAPAVAQSGAGQSATGQSGSGAGGQSAATGGQSTVDGPMSNGYRVGPDGRLLQPDQGNLTPPELPDEAKQETPEGAQAFAKHYVELHIYTWKVGDISPLKGKVTPECSNCANTVKQVDGLYSAGGWIDPKGNAEIHVREIISHENVQSGGAPHSVIVDFTLPGHTAYQNGTLSSIDSISQTAAIDCCWVDNQWKACGLNARTN